jgi:hypothetical protein
MGLLSDGFGIRQIQNQIGPESVDTGRPVADIETAKPELSSVINITDVIDASRFASPVSFIQVEVLLSTVVDTSEEL